LDGSIGLYIFLVLFNRGLSMKDEVFKVNSTGGLGEAFERCHCTKEMPTLDCITSA
jgi:hypothetical protein